MDYSIIDSSVLLQFLFHPRKDYASPPPGAFDFMVPVEGGVEIHCRGYPAGKEDPWLLYFHGNGEVVSDYNYIAPYYQKESLNLLVADYRGYGESSGTPTFTDMVKDASRVLEESKKQLKERSQDADNLWVMGRSLGSICALELAAKHPGELRGMVVESGFISVTKLIRHLGLPAPGDLTALEEEAHQKAGNITLPALVIHGERDQLVPLEQGEELYNALSSSRKRLFTIPLGDHNNIFLVETERYLQEIKKFVEDEQ